MKVSGCEFGKLALTAVPAASLLGDPLLALAQEVVRPNSVINGVNLGTLTYSYRSMPDQSAEAILDCVADSGISQIEFMGGPVEAFAGAPQTPGGVGRRGQPQTPEQEAARREATERLRAWRTSVSLNLSVASFSRQPSRSSRSLGCRFVAKLVHSGSLFKTAARMCDAFLPVNTCRPLSISNSTTPNDPVSALLSVASPPACSGDIYAAVPRIIPCCVAAILKVGELDTPTSA